MAQDGSGSLVLALIFLVLFIVIWTLCLIGWRTARNRYTGPSLPSRLTTLPPKSVPGVTIIRPLCGLDNNLYSTLESVMKLEYPKFEVIFALQDEQDEALGVVRLIMEKYPTVDARIIIDKQQVGVNPKVNNLLTPFAQAKYDLLWVVDSTIAIPPGAFGRAVDAFVGYPPPFASSFEGDLENTPLLSDDVRRPPVKGEVGLVHHVPLAVVYQRTWGSLIEQAFLNTTHAKMYLAINTVAIDSCVIGKANMYSRSNIASLTSPSPTLRSQPDSPSGLAGFAPFLAEDNMIALSLWHELGLKHAMTSDVALDFLGALSVRDYIARRVRWIRVRKKMTPIAATLLEPFTESILCSLYGSWAISRLLGGSVVALWAVNMAVWLAVDMSVREALSTNVKSIGPPRAGLGVFVLAWLAREMLALPIWFLGVFGSEVIWRGRRYRVEQSGEAIRLD